MITSGKTLDNFLIFTIQPVDGGRSYILIQNYRF